MRMGEHYRIDVIEAGSNMGEVRQDQIHPGLVFFRKQDADVDDEQPSGMFQDGHVATDFAKATKWNDTQPQRVEGWWV